MSYHVGRSNGQHGMLETGNTTAELNSSLGSYYIAVAGYAARDRQMQPRAFSPSRLSGVTI